MLLELVFSPPNKTILDYYDDVNVTCKSNYRGTLEWFSSIYGTKIKDNDTAKVSSFWVKPPTTDMEFRQLRIKRATDDEAGKYFCKKTDVFNNTKTNGIDIKIKGRLMINLACKTYNGL